MDASLSSEMETMVPDSITSESQEAAKVVTSAKLELSPESEMELALDSISPDSKMEVTADSEEVAVGDVGPDSEKVAVGDVVLQARRFNTAGKANRRRY